MASGRRRLDVIYGLILLSGLVISAALLAALAALRSSSGDPWLLVFALGASGLLPSLVAWLAGAVGSFLRPTDPGVRLATALNTLQLLLWLGLVALGRWSNMPTPPTWLLVVPMIVTAGYGLAATWLALRWFVRRRRTFPDQVAA
jgi:hypothetical protein